MKLKFYLIIICLIVFGCKNKVSYDGVLIHRNDMTFEYAPNSIPEHDIFLKTSISDSKFPDKVRYYLIYPKDGEYQNLKNNLGRKVKVKGEEEYYYPNITAMVEDNPNYDPNKKYYNGIDEYRLKDAKIVKVY